MKVKIKCNECGTIKTLKVDTLKETRKIKRVNKDWLCNVCEFKIILKRAARQIIKENKKLC
jgi:DNA-directed RNA polymerase subunit RPC12/RpoP